MQFPLMQFHCQVVGVWASCSLSAILPAPMDRSQAWREAVERACQGLRLPDAQVTQVKEALIMRPVKKPTDFAVVASQVANSISELAALIQGHQKGYLASSLYSSQEKDELEAEVGRCVKMCGQQVERLKQSVLASQQRQHLSGQAAAHLHGMVLILAEHLQRTASVFDGYRVQRYQQMREDERRRRHPSLARGPPPWQTSSSSQQEGGRPRQAGSNFTGSSMQQQALVEENRSLVAHLSQTEQQVLGIEKSVVEISTLNQLFSAAISSQAEAIEAIYEHALQSSAFVVAGNVQLDKTIKANRSTQYYIFVLLLVATLCLVFFDWLNS